MKIDIPVEVKDILHKALIWGTEEFLEELLDYYSAATFQTSSRCKASSRCKSFPTASSATTPPSHGIMKKRQRKKRMQQRIVKHYLDLFAPCSVYIKLLIRRWTRKERRPQAH